MAILKNLFAKKIHPRKSFYLIVYDIRILVLSKQYMQYIMVAMYVSN